MNNRSDFPVKEFNLFRQQLIELKIIINDRFSTTWQKYWNEELNDMFNYLSSFLSSESELKYCLAKNILPITEDYLCPICHTNYVAFNNRTWRLTCKNCSSNKLKQKIEKAKQTNLERNGVITNLATKENQQKIHSKNSIEKAKITRQQTNLERYGAVSPTQVKEINQKQINTKRKNIENFMKEYNCTLFKDLIKQYGQGWLSLNLPKIYNGYNAYISNDYLDEIIEYSKSTHTNNYTSNKEKELANFIKSLGVPIIENDSSTVSNRNGRHFELDIYVPEKQVAYDFDGIYWHSTLFKDKKYHQRKTNYCQEDGIRLIHVFEDLWDNKKEIYKSIIKSSLNIYDRRIYARDCEFCKLSTKEYKDFLDNNHLFGAVNSTHRYGLKYNNELVQVVGFGKSRFKDKEMELHRMCSLLNTQIVGGFSKLIKHSNIKNFISYVDLATYNGQGYVSLGFTVIGKTEPGYFYCKDGIRYNRLNFQKHKLKDKLDIYDNNLSESDNMLNNGYLKIYDAGNLKLFYKE